MTDTLTTETPKEIDSAPTTTRREPDWPIGPLGLTFGRLLDNLWTHWWPEGESQLVSPPLDVADDDDAFVVTAELPGIKKDDVKIKYQDGILTITGEKSSETEEKKAHYHRMERRYGAFCRSLALPSSVDPERIEGTMDSGVLTIRLPKSAAVKGRSIEIK